MRRLLPLLLTVATSACAGAEPDAPEGDVASEALAVVALTWRASDAAGLAQAYVIEHAPGRRAAALGVLSLPAANLVLDTSLGVGECRVDGPRGDAGPMLLRDAGEIAVEGELGVSVLESSWLPEGSLNITGVAYAGLLTPRAHASKSLQVMADGSPEVGPFAVVLTPPHAVKLVAVGGHEVAKGRVQLSDGELTQALDVVWEPLEGPPVDGDSGATSDLTAVVFERKTFGAAWTISCAVKDDGHFTIPAGALSALPDLGADRTDSVLVRRIASASFSARHLPEGLALSVSEDQAYVE